ncbi:MAG: hypothetical protein PHH84_01390 [Oscillospiraceae bacterium]|nr:hypothetical protein [Oscillospiraceae bacterium]MDD4412954.1 hypothetical protein [Oscillospiraceae bacterium]
MCFEAFAIAAGARALNNCCRNDNRGIGGERDRRRRCRERDSRVEAELFRRGIEPTMNHHLCCYREEHDCCCRRRGCCS